MLSKNVIWNNNYTRTNIILGTTLQMNQLRIFIATQKVSNVIFQGTDEEIMESLRGGA
jgi:hypothetical protein